MKRVIIAVFLLLTSVALSIFGCCYASGKAQYFADEIISLKEKIAARDETSIESSYDLIKEWKKTHEALSFYMSHDRIGDLDEALCQIPAYIAYGSFADAVSICDKFHRQVLDITKNEKVTLGNIL